MYKFLEQRLNYNLLQMKCKIHRNIFREWMPLLAVSISLCWAYSVVLLLWHRPEVAKQSFAASFWSLPKFICFLSRSIALCLTAFFRPTCLCEENVYLVNCERFSVFRAGHWGQKSDQLWHRYFNVYTSSHWCPLC